MFRLFAFALFCLAACPASSQDFRPLVVLHSVAAPVDIGYVNSVIGKMNAIIKTIAPCDNIQFYRGAAPEVSADVPATINTSRQVQGLFDSSDANVLVPRFLSYCGRPDAGYAGCSSRNKTAIVEFQPNTDLAALLWLHEIGHSHKLSHVDDSLRLMYPIVGVGRQKIIGSECAEYIAGNEKFPIFQAAVVDVGNLVPAEGISTAVGEDQVAVLKSVLEGPWAGGTADATKILDPMSVQMPNFLSTIRQILLDDKQIVLWPNSVLALGIYGDESDITFLQSFLMRSHPSSDYTVQSLSNIPFAIGYLSGKYASTQGLQILQASAEVEAAGALIEQSGEGPAVAEARPEFCARVADCAGQGRRRDFATLRPGRCKRAGGYAGTECSRGHFRQDRPRRRRAPA